MATTNHASITDIVDGVVLSIRTLSQVSTDEDYNKLSEKQKDWIVTSVAKMCKRYKVDVVFNENGIRTLLPATFKRIDRIDTNPELDTNVVLHRKAHSVLSVFHHYMNDARKKCDADCMPPPIIEFSEQKKKKKMKKSPNSASSTDDNMSPAHDLCNEDDCVDGDDDGGEKEEEEDGDETDSLLEADSSSAYEKAGDADDRRSSTSSNKAIRPMYHQTTAETGGDRDNNNKRKANTQTPMNAERHTQNSGSGGSDGGVISKLFFKNDSSKKQKKQNTSSDIRKGVSVDQSDCHSNESGTGISPNRSKSVQLFSSANTAKRANQSKEQMKKKRKLEKEDEKKKKKKKKKAMNKQPNGGLLKTKAGGSSGCSRSVQTLQAHVMTDNLAPITYLWKGLKVPHCPRPVQVFVPCGYPVSGDPPLQTYARLYLIEHKITHEESKHQGELAIKMKAVSAAEGINNGRGHNLSAIWDAIGMVHLNWIPSTRHSTGRRTRRGATSLTHVVANPSRVRGGGGGVKRIPADEWKYADMDLDKSMQAWFTKAETSDMVKVGLRNFLLLRMVMSGLACVEDASLVQDQVSKEVFPDTPALVRHLHMETVVLHLTCNGGGSWQLDTVRKVLMELEMDRKAHGQRDGGGVEEHYDQTGVVGVDTWGFKAAALVGDAEVGKKEAKLAKHAVGLLSNYYTTYWEKKNKNKK